jgi:hypothetical protein
MVLGKRKFRLAQMKLIFPGEGLLRDPKSSQEAPIEMVHSFESPLISRSNKLKLYLLNIHMIDKQQNLRLNRSHSEEDLFKYCIF